MTDEKGYIKFNCLWNKSDAVPGEVIHEINWWRSKLFELGLIGVYPGNIGFGNLSIRLHENIFLITGNSTGHLPELTAQHFSKVTSFNITENSVTCDGPVKASSESLTHAAIYLASPDVNAIVHVHSRPLWNKLMNVVPTSSPVVEYGTPEMALEIERLFHETDLKEKKILVMAGHEEGLISFGKNMEEAGNIMLSHLR